MANKSKSKLQLSQRLGTQLTMTCKVRTRPFTEEEFHEHLRKVAYPGGLNGYELLQKLKAENKPLPRSLRFEA